MANPFVDAHKDFVLKLKFVGTDESSQEVRRVRLPRVVDSQGEVSYEELVGLVLSIVIPENPANSSDFKVKLTYKDVDDDLVVIGSSHELIDAIDQFSEQRVLRISAEVKRYRYVTQQQQQRPTMADASETSRASSESPLSHRAGVPNAGAPSARNSQPAPVLQHVVESVVNIILNAAPAIGGRQQGHTPVFYTPDGIPADVAAAEAPPSPKDPTEQTASGAQASPPEPEAPPEAAGSKIQTQEDGGAAPKEDLKDDPKATPKEAPKEPPIETSKETSAAGKTDAGGKTKEERPFIHGRHTCDICLTTPIIGKRFHAVNMSDYDLCENCFNNYGGSEIQFEPVELERDRHLQNRWYRRKEKMNTAKGGSGGGHQRFLPGHHKRWGPGPRGPHGPVPPGPGPLGRPPFGPPPHHPPFGPPHHPPYGPFGMPPHHPHHGPPPPPHFFQPHRGPRGGFGGPPPGPPPTKDCALDLAIRRSLEDAMKRSAEKEPASGYGASANVDEAVAAVSVSVGTKENVQIVAVQETKAPVKPAPVPSAVQEEPRPLSSDGSGGSSCAGKPASKADESVKVATVNDDDEDEEEEAAVGLEHGKDVQIPSGQAFGSPAREIADTDDVAGSLGEILDLCTAIEDPAQEKETSFSSDAAGSGDVAVSLGETLDLCATAIHELQEEIMRSSPERKPSMDDSTSSSYVGVTGEAEEENANGQEEATDAKSEQENAGVVEPEGATIVESADGDEGNFAAPEQSEEDWHVVTEDQQISSDEDLARAAQMIGSALFNSDMRSSGEVMSTLTGSAAESDAISFASSVPTTVHSVATTSHIAVAQLDRWAPQLEQLHSLGIDDDARCVDILERLTAANIGCGSFDDEVSVQQVVNELWKN